MKNSKTLEADIRKIIADSFDKVITDPETIGRREEIIEKTLKVILNKAHSSMGLEGEDPDLEDDMFLSLLNGL